MSAELEAVIGTTLSDHPYKVWVVAVGGAVNEVEPIGEFVFDAFTPSAAANLNDFLLRRGYVAVSPWHDQIEFRVANVISSL